MKSVEQTCFSNYCARFIYKHIKYKNSFFFSLNMLFNSEMCCNNEIIMALELYILLTLTAFGHCCKERTVQ